MLVNCPLSRLPKLLGQLDLPGYDRSCAAWLTHIRLQHNRRGRINPTSRVLYPVNVGLRAPTTRLYSWGLLQANHGPFKADPQLLAFRYSTALQTFLESCRPYWLSNDAHGSFRVQLYNEAEPRTKTNWPQLRWLDGTRPDPWQQRLPAFTPRHWFALREWAFHEITFFDSYLLRPRTPWWVTREERIVAIYQHEREQTQLLRHLREPQQRLTHWQLQRWLGRNLPVWARLTDLQHGATTTLNAQLLPQWCWRGPTIGRNTITSRLYDIYSQQDYEDETSITTWGRWGRTGWDAAPQYPQPGVPYFGSPTRLDRKSWPFSASSHSVRRMVSDISLDYVVPFRVLPLTRELELDAVWVPQVDDPPAAAPPEPRPPMRIDSTPFIFTEPRALLPRIT